MPSGAEDDQILKMLAELEGDSGSEPEQSRPGYVSCVRVAGEPILPPVMTDQTRLEALTWRRRALDVEERLAARRREKLAVNISYEERRIFFRPGRDQKRLQGEAD